MISLQRPVQLLIFIFLLLGLRLNDLLIGRGINPLVLLCLGFLNKKPRNTNSEMKIRVSITYRPMVVLMLMAQLDNVSPQAFG